MAHLSVIVLGQDPVGTERLIASLAAQSARQDLELVLVASEPEQFFSRFDLAGFGRISRVRHGVLPSSSAARVAGLRAATAPAVVFTEDHCYPLPDWAEALIARHAEPWTGVGPAFLNANPESAVSRANFLAEHGPWAEPRPGGPMAHISGHNSSYKREPLLALGEGLSAMLEAESTMQWRLGEEGHSFYFEPLARVRHYNFSRMADSLWLHFHLGWLFGANRFRPRDPRRLVYLAGWPFIAPLRLLRALRDAARVGTQVNLPVLLTLLGFNALGEAVGYAIGRSGPPMAACTASEYGRSRYLTAADRARFLAEPTGHSPGIAASSLRL